MLQPSAGTALIGGLDIRTAMPRIRQSLGICPQFDILWPDVTVREHLTLFAVIKGAARGEDAAARAVRAAAEVGLADKLDCLAEELSGGQRRKLSVAIAFLGNPAGALTGRTGESFRGKGGGQGGGQGGEGGGQAGVDRDTSSLPTRSVAAPRPPSPCVCLPVCLPRARPSSAPFPPHQWCSWTSPPRGWTPTAGGPPGTSSAGGEGSCAWRRGAGQ